MGILKSHKEILFILIFSGAIVLSAGLTSDVYVGDEVHHYRFAKDMYAAGKRVAYDPLYPSGNPPGYFYNSEPLWSGLLAVLWKLTGNISFAVAQIYHTFYYLLLILFTYLLGLQIYGKREGLYAALLVSSVPMVVSFSILFYLDVPGTGLAALSLFLLFKRRYFLAGLGISLMYFSRRNACFLVPGFVSILFIMEKENWLIKLKSLIYFVFPTGILGFLDLQWRRVHIEGAKYAMAGMDEFTTVSTWNYFKSRLSKLLWGSGEYLNSSLVNPKDVIQYFGISLLLALFLYFLLKKNKREDLALWVCVILYFVSFAFLFGMNSDIRYLSPVIPLLCVLAASSFKSFGNLKWLNVSILAMCLLQLLGTSLYVHQRRLIPEGMKEGFEFIKQNTPVDALCMYPGYIFIEATGRRFIWSSFFQVEVWAMKKRYDHLDLEKDKSVFLFWSKNEEDMRKIMEMNKLDYIVVDKSRIYDDADVRHFGGYPKSFAERLPTLRLVKNIFENQAMSIWEVKREKPGDYFRMRKEEG